LRAAIEAAVALSGDAPRIEHWHLPGANDQDSGTSPRSEFRRASAERAAVLRAINASRGNLSDAARVLGVARSTLYRMIARHGLKAGDSIEPS